MKRKLVIVLYVILICITIKLIYNTVFNCILIGNYSKGVYKESKVKPLTYLNFIQKYVANYNYGNILYQNGEYERAIEKYEEALKGNIPKEKECSIRINYALAICKTVHVNESDETSIKNAIEIYESAIDVLTENGCANKEDNNGHSAQAEQLKQDIQKEIDRLKELLNGKSDTPKDDEKDESKEDNEKEKDIESEMQEIKEEALQEQRNEEKAFENFGDFSFDKPDKNW